MANWENVMVDTDQMETGKFYKIYTNKDNATLLISKETDDKQCEDLEVVKQITLDNQARINNLEDTEVNKIIGFLDKISIKKNFIDATRVEIQHRRKEVINVKIMKIDSVSPDTTREVNVTAGTSITEEVVKDTNGNVVSKKVILDFGNTPITGYAIIL